MTTLKHIIKSQSFTMEFLQDIFNLTHDMKNGKFDNICLNGKVVATLFYEPSTRTRLSFESAALRLGAKVISTENAGQFSSAIKGEVLSDSIKTVAMYSDCIVLRYFEEGGASTAAHVSNVPIINAGDGKGQHPTQALLDLFTIKDELGAIDGLSVALVGDLKHGRTIHSLAYLLAKFKQVKLCLISPENLKIPRDILEYLDRHDVKYEEFSDFQECINDVDVLYQTRVQKERFDDPEEYANSVGLLTVTRALAEKMKHDSIILHPMPRISEIRYGVDSDHRAKYFTQAQNGLYVRMALLQYILT